MGANLKTIAFLMLLAGVSLGIFASRALRALGPRDTTPTAGAAVPSTIEQQVELYERYYQLDPRRTDQIRQTLLRYDRGVRDKLLELRSRHAEEFRALFEAAEKEITDVLATAEAPAGR
jgi:hypothetical protein